MIIDMGNRTTCIVVEFDALPSKAKMPVFGFDSALATFDLLMVTNIVW